MKRTDKPHDVVGQVKQAASLLAVSLASVALVWASATGVIKPGDLAAGWLAFVAASPWLLAFVFWRAGR